MDLKSIVRVFRYSELEKLADHNPEAKRPPTIKFLGVFVILTLVVATIGVVCGAGRHPHGGAGSRRPGRSGTGAGAHPWLRLPKSRVR